MKTKQVFISFDTGYCSAEIDVPGLGLIGIKDFISDETKERIANEAEAAMRSRLDAVAGYAGADFGKHGRWND